MTPALARVAILVACAGLGAAAGARLGVAPGVGAVVALAAGLLVIALEARLASTPTAGLLVGAVGALAGLVVGLGTGAAVGLVLPTGGREAAGLLGLLGGYAGLAIALRRRRELESALGGRLAAARARPEARKLLDTSALVDGRIADVCVAGMLEGPLVVPQFVLRELQQLADSGDITRRNRGRRGFDVLQRLQGMDTVTVEIVDADVPSVPDVDRKLLELARSWGGKIVTTDHNLGRLAEVSGVAVLNLNEVARALRPVALPGEAINVRVLREGKESGQGVAYLDDGTMVVVEQGKRFVGQTIDVTVTSVLQTSAGRMIFSRPRDQEAVGAARGGDA
jgi:uncharacterized protein YacL